MPESKINLKEEYHLKVNVTDDLQYLTCLVIIIFIHISNIYSLIF